MGPLACIRRAALDMFIVLCKLKESTCVPQLPLSDDVSSDHSSQSRVASPAELTNVPTNSSFSVLVMWMGGRRESILVWDEEEDNFSVEEERECMPRERWDT